jgi:hypothetical protein
MTFRGTTALQPLSEKNRFELGASDFAVHCCDKLKLVWAKTWTQK